MLLHACCATASKEHAPEESGPVMKATPKEPATEEPGPPNKEPAPQIVHKEPPHDLASNTQKGREGTGVYITYVMHRYAIAVQFP